MYDMVIGGGGLELARPHTIKKFELVEKYVESWAPKLLNHNNCTRIVYIDCMCNSGVYQNIEGSVVLGTALRVANYLAKIMLDYPTKKATLFFRDICPKKVSLLKSHLPPTTANFSISIECGDGNRFLKSSNVHREKNSSYLVFYDPYEAAIDWSALNPFLLGWGEVIINHMISDSVRAIPQVKSERAKNKYEQTYLATLENLISVGEDKELYEKRIHEVMMSLRGSSAGGYYIASFPFFNSKNALLYHLIHGSRSRVGFNLFKKTAWKTFGGKSSCKNVRSKGAQLQLDFDDTGIPTISTDEECYSLWDIANYLYGTFRGKADVPVNVVWDALNHHPVFPESGFRRDIKRILEEDFKAHRTTKTISFC